MYHFILGLWFIFRVPSMDGVNGNNGYLSTGGSYVCFCGSFGILESGGDEVILGAELCGVHPARVCGHVLTSPSEFV